jgi:hypothetical protein
LQHGLASLAARHLRAAIVNGPLESKATLVNYPVVVPASFAAEEQIGAWTVLDSHLSTCRARQRGETNNPDLSANASQRLVDTFGGGPNTDPGTVSPESMLANGVEHTRRAAWRAS